MVRRGLDEPDDHGERGANDASFVSFFGSVPSTMTTGETRTVHVMMSNDGESTWTRAGGFELASENPPDNTTWGASRVEIGESDSVGPHTAYTFSFTITAPSSVGEYEFQWQMAHDGGRFGSTTPSKTIAVEAAGTTMSLTLDRKTIDVGGVTQVTATGTGLDDARFFIGTGQSGRTYPTVSLVSVNDSGTSATLDIDATDTKIDGYYGLYATTTAKAAGHAIFRVVPDRVVVDAYTPSTSGGGYSYVVSIIGVNLDRATLGVSDARVELTGVTHAPDGLAIGGVATVPKDVSSFDLQLSSPGASNVSLPVSEAGVEPASDGSTIAAVGAPNLLYQKPVRPPSSAGSGSTADSTTDTSAPPLDRIVQPFSFNFQLCYNHGERWSLVSEVASAALSYDPDTKELASHVLQRLIPGSSLQLETMVFQLQVRLALTINLQACVNFGPGGLGFDFGLEVCLASDVIISIPAVGTTRFWGYVCLSAIDDGEVPLGVHGALGAYGWSKRFGTGSPPGNLDTCVTTTDLETDPEKGLRRTLVQTGACCTSSPELAVAASGTAYFGEFSVGETNQGGLENATCAAESKQRRVVVRAFIPWKWVATPPFVYCNNLRGGLIFGGDDRGPMANPALRELAGKTNPEGAALVLEAFRLSASIVIPPVEPSDPDGPVAALQTLYAVGSSTEFHRGSTLQDGELNLDDYDNVYDDCFRINRVATANIGSKDVGTVLGKKADRIVVDARMQGKIPLNLPSWPIPNINWEADLSIALGTTTTEALKGEIKHDCMPAYEVYFDDTLAYHWKPDDSVAEKPTTAIRSVSARHWSEEGCVHVRPDSRWQSDVFIQDRLRNVARNGRWPGTLVFNENPEGRW